MQFDDFFKNELLFQKGINYNDLPGWQKKGVGVYFKDIEKEGFDPIKKETVKAVRRELYADLDIPLGEEYKSYVLSFME